MLGQDDDVKGLFPQMDLSRRGFVMTSLATGFALSVQPAGATVVTDATGLTAGEIKIPVADGVVPAYRAQPAGAGPFPVLLVIEEIFGVHEHIKDMCRRFAKAGYLAIAPELYARLGDVVHIEKIEDVIKVVNQAPDPQSFSDLDATVAWAEKHGGDAKRVGITGWCRGGRMVWMYAAHSSAIKAGVAWYGPLGGKTSEAMPQTPLDIGGTLKVPVLGLYGGLDKGIPQADIDAMKQKLAAAHDESEFIVYPDAEHGFNADYRPSYNEKDATDGMKRCLAWLKGHGVG